jgi:hypothetical protein
MVRWTIRLDEHLIRSFVRFWEENEDLWDRGICTWNCQKIAACLGMPEWKTKVLIRELVRQGFLEAHGRSRGVTGHLRMPEHVRRRFGGSVTR